MNQRTFLFGAAAVALMAVTVAAPGFADATGATNAGGTALTGLSTAITGNIGLLLGLGLTIAGLWVWIIGQKTSVGVTMIVGGVAFTLAPGLFDGVRKLASAPIAAMTGSDDVRAVDRSYGVQADE